MSNGLGASESKLQGMREVIAGLLGLAIAVVTLFMLADTYQAGKKPVPTEPEAVVKATLEAYGHQKDILLLALTLLGTVTGYYLGRVPAELRAQQGQQAAVKAQEQASEANRAASSSAEAARSANDQAEKAQKQADAGKAAVVRARDALGQAPPSSKTLGAQPSQQEQAIERAQRELDDYLRHL